MEIILTFLSCTKVKAFICVVETEKKNLIILTNVSDYCLNTSFMSCVLFFFYSIETFSELINIKRISVINVCQG